MYSLKLFNKTLLKFDMFNDPTLKIRNIDIVLDDRDLFPEVLKKDINEDSIKEFLVNRIIPKNRAFVKDILTSYGLDVRDIKGVIDISKGLSLTDSYWVISDESLDFEKYNLFDNEFSKTLSLIAFTGYTSKVKGIKSSPEFSTDGMLPKAWRRIDNIVYLYKGSSDQTWKVTNSGNEPYSEYYACQIEEKMGIKHVDYDLKKWKGLLASVCPIFTSKEYSFVPIYLASNSKDIDDIHLWCVKNGFEEEFADMIVFDALIFNNDRHLGNFGVLKDNISGKYISFAPLFDNGAGLLSLGTTSAFESKDAFDDYWKNDKYLQVSNYGVKYDVLVKLYCNKKQVSKLRKLADFKFKKHPRYNLPNTRIKLLNDMVIKRSIKLIDIIEKNK